MVVKEIPISSARLGTWRKPPLAYVVAEIVISPYYSVGDSIAGLQNSLRTYYPRTVEGQEIVFDGLKPATQQVWRLTSADNTHGVQIGTSRISLHATSYIDSADFLGRWATVLEAVAAANLSAAFVERAGLRYVDLIVPSGERSPADYVHSHLQGVVPGGASAMGSIWTAAFQFDESLVNLRVAAPSPAGLILPPQFNALPLHKPQVLSDAESRSSTGQSIGYIDTDCIHEVQSTFSSPAIVDCYTKMQQKTSATFKAALSDVARGEWI